jgi:FkbM family methyltransferase
MSGILQALKTALPKPVKDVLRRIVYRTHNKPLKPYLKRKNVEGVDFDFWIGDSDGRDWYDLKCTDPVWNEMRFVRDNLVKPGDVVLECGGHHGCTAILLSHWVGAGGKVVTFEPSPANCKIIEKNIRQNRLTNVTLERAAVGDKQGLTRISESSNSSVCPTGAGVEVKMTCLDEYAHLNPSLLKIDVEGFEVQVLQGAKKILSTRPYLDIEIHAEPLKQYGASVGDVFKLIGVENYKVWIQWEDVEQPQEYDLRTPIEKRVHVFCIPRTR